MKLLASLLGCTVADWACCPYDEFGVVNVGCPLSEKTPWAMKTSNTAVDPEGVTDHLCKAWEANIDATMEGNDDFDNWGGCGFQRHFPWSMTRAAGNGLAHDFSGIGAANQYHCQFGVMDCGTASSSNAVYTTLKTGTLAFSLISGPFSASGDNVVFGDVTLGGVCKLWVPVVLEAIDSVHVAGIHMNGGGTDMNNMAGGGSAAVFNGAEVCNGDCAAVITKAAGTAFCFSVVNIGEFMENTNMVMNANVAGMDAGGHDPFPLAGTESVGDFTVDFGGSITPTNPDGGGNSIVNAGASFDVVVHFKSQWCISHWTIIDMQTAPDWGSDADDYMLEGSPPHHHHSDVADKRFDGQVGMCGCCSGGTRHDVGTAGGATVLARGCTKCADNIACTEFNKYAEMVTLGMMWPNAGAWAAFYSFVTCADGTFMIYDRASAVAGDGSLTKTTHARITVHSMFYNDVRHDWENADEHSGSVVIRGNFRQVGSGITNCGPGVIDTGDTKRCTWNWNFLLSSDGSDAEDWFERVAPQAHRVWLAGAEQDRNIEAEAFAGLITEVVSVHSFAVVFQNDADLGTNAVDTDDTFTLDADKYFTLPAATLTVADGHRFDFNMHCLESDPDGGGTPVAGSTFAALGDDGTSNVRDMFPDCYMGDEIHFSYVISDGESTDDHRLNAWFSYTVFPFGVWED